MTNNVLLWTSYIMVFYASYSATVNCHLRNVPKHLRKSVLRDVTNTPNKQIMKYNLQLRWRVSADIGLQWRCFPYQFAMIRMGWVMYYGSHQHVALALMFCRSPADTHVSQLGHTEMQPTAWHVTLLLSNTCMLFQLFSLLPIALVPPHK